MSAPLSAASLEAVRRRLQQHEQEKAAAAVASDESEAAGAAALPKEQFDKLREGVRLRLQV